jgi:hypothetical protein
MSDPLSASTADNGFCALPTVYLYHVCSYSCTGGSIMCDHYVLCPNTSFTAFCALPQIHNYVPNRAVRILERVRSLKSLHDSMHVIVCLLSATILGVRDEIIANYALATTFDGSLEMLVSSISKVCEYELNEICLEHVVALTLRPKAFQVCV